MEPRALLWRPFAALALAVLPGCFPLVMRYVELDGPGVSHKRFPCYDGAPVGATLERGGVRFEVALDPHGLSPLPDPYMKLRAPRTVTISIPDPVASLKFDGRSEARSVRLEATPLEWQGSHVAEARRKSPMAEYRFVFVDLPPIEAPGTLRLPVVLIDGTAVEAPVLSFRPRSYAGLVPLNC